MSNRGRLFYALDHYSDHQLDTLARELAQSPHNEALQETLRARLQRELYAGENKRAKRTQRALGTLCDHHNQKEKDRMNEQQQAAKLLEMIAQNPQKIDLIEGLAKKAGWLSSSAAPETPESTAEEKTERKKVSAKPAPKKPETKKGGRPKGQSTMLEGRRKLTNGEVALARELLKDGRGMETLAKQMGAPLSSLSGALRGTGGLTVESINKLLEMGEQREAAE